MGCLLCCFKKIKKPVNPLNELNYERIIRIKNTDEHYIDNTIENLNLRESTCKPFRGSIMEPTNHQLPNPSIPDEDYKLEYVYGFRIHNTRQNLYYNSSGSVVYCAASLGIILNPESNTQKFFGSGYSTTSTGKRHHYKDIICLRVSQDGTLAATGEIGSRPILNIWNANTGDFITNFVVTEEDTRAITCCAWSVDNRYIAFASKSNDFKIYIIDAVEGNLVESKPIGYQIFDIAWSKKPGDYTFAFVGVKNIGFWTVGQDKKKGTGHGNQSFSSITYNEYSTCYAGTFEGKIYIFNETVSGKSVSAHEEIITAMCWNNGKLYTGGADNRFGIFDCNLKKLSSFNLDSSPRAIDVNDERILVGLKDGSICIISEKTKKIDQCLMKSHNDGEIWGLDVTEEGKVITSADRKSVV